ncbi:MAG: efflux RND transporter periplasmic adaptor subunit [Gammaproteobacteria bacterium]|nr:efflux RND transporter periplasmic adaptor subunit [Gammaproteobacteria bacterium]
MRMTKPLLVPSLLCLAILGLTGCAEDAKSDEKKAEAAIPVETRIVELGEIAAAYTSTATLEAEQESAVASKASGIVTKLFVEEGDKVKAGQVLAQLDTDRLSLEVERNKATLVKMQKELERSALLHAKKLISTDAHDKLKFEVEALKAAYDLAALELKNATIVAPIDGIVTERMIKVGNMVELNKPTFHISDFDPMHAVLHVPERELSKLKAGQEAQVSADALSDQLFTGLIKRIAPVVDPATGTFKVTVEVRDPAVQLKPGMFGRVNVVYDLHKEARLVAKDAILAEDNVNTVFIVKDNVAYRQTVETGFSSGNLVEITGGLNAGDTVVTAGHASLKDKTKVELLKM